MNSMKLSVSSAACSAFIFALAAVANAQTAQQITAVDAVEAAVADDDSTLSSSQSKFGKKNVSNKKNVPAAVYLLNGNDNGGTTQYFTNKRVISTEQDENGIASYNGADLHIQNVAIEKTGDSSNEDQSNFRGINAALYASTAGKIDATGMSIATDAIGANAVFAFYNKSYILVKKSKIVTKQDSSRGCDATYGGSVDSRGNEITTYGAHSATFATDRGGGTIYIKSNDAKTSGEGSPIFYSTGEIEAEYTTGFSGQSEIGVIEGKNKLSIAGGSYTCGGANGFMLYQSTSGDAEDGTAMLSSLNAKYTTTGNGSFIYVTNTDASISLSDDEINAKSDVFLTAFGNNSERGWGMPGENGATVAIVSKGTKINGDICCDEISSVDFSLGSGSFTGAIDKENAGSVSLKLYGKWNVTADSYVETFFDEDARYKNINSNGHTVYYEKSANPSLRGRTYRLIGGGKLRPYTKEYSGTSGTSGMNGKTGKSGAAGSNGAPGYGEGGGAGAGNLPVPGIRGIEPADSSGNIGSSGDDKNGMRGPRITSLAGYIRVTGKGSKRTVDLICSTGSRYSLSVMDEGQRPDRPEGISPDPDTRPVPFNSTGIIPSASKITPVVTNENHEPPKKITMDELAEMDGVHVVLRGFLTDESKKLFTVIEYEKQK